MIMKRVSANVTLSLFAGLLTLLVLSGSVLADWAETNPVEQAVIRLPLSKASPKVDGAPGDGEYADAVVLGGSFRGWGFSPRPQSPTVYLKRDAERLYVLYDNPLKAGERPSMGGAVPDASGICLGNAIELFFLPKLPDGTLLQYIQFIGNARGCIYDAKSTPQVGVTYVAEFNVPWSFRNKIIPGHWYSEISAKFSDLMIAKTTDGEYFDFDCGRDGGTGPNGVHSYTMAYHAIQNGAGVRVIFDATAPVVQWLRFGDFENNTFNPALRLKGTGRADTYTVGLILTEAKLGQDKKRKTIYSKKLEIALGADQAKDVSVSFDLKPKSEGVAHYRITDSRGKVVFYRKLGYKTTLTAPPLYPKAESAPLVVTARMAPSYGRIGATADIIDYKGDKKNVVVEVTAFRQGSQKPLARVTIDKFRLNYGEGILDVGKLTEGAYLVKFRVIDRKSGKPLGINKQIALVRKVYEWENNTLGMTDKVIHPWTPMKVTGDAVRCWGRTYRFTGLALPKSIDTLQPQPARSAEKVRNVLSSPVRLVAERGGKAIEWKPLGSRIVGAKETEVSLAGAAEAPGLKAEVRGTLEYDGFYKIRLKITPTKQVRIDSLRVEVPIPTESARLFHHVGESMRTNKTFADFEGRSNGVLWDSRSAARNAVIKGNFVPVTWIGDEDRGVAWMCDTDRTWVTTFDKPCLDVVRKGDETAFRMHLVNRPATLTKPIEVTFSLQATPIRPRPSGGSWKKVEWYGWSQFDKPLLWHECLEPYKQGKGYKWLRTKKAREEDLWWRYGCFSSDRISTTDKSYGQIIKDFGAEWYCESIWTKYQNKAHQDFELWAYKQWCEIGGMDGVYYDNTFPSPSTNLLNGTAHIDDRGRLRAGYSVMAFREYIKRLRTMFLSYGPPPVLKAHITDTPIPGYLGFCDFWLDGENGGYPSSEMKNPDFVDRWYNKTGMANLRITMGQQWGTMPQYLYDWGIEPTHAILGMFDLENRYKAMGKQPYHEFGRYETNVRFIPYWSRNIPAAVVKGGGDVLLTLWKRPSQVRILISNLSNEDRSIDVKVHLAKLGLRSNAMAVDEREGSQLDMAGNVVRNIRVSRHDYRTIIVADQGVHQYLHGHGGP